MRLLNYLELDSPKLLSFGPLPYGYEFRRLLINLTVQSSAVVFLRLGFFPKPPASSISGANFDLANLRNLIDVSASSAKGIELGDIIQNLDIATASRVPVQWELPLLVPVQDLYLCLLFDANNTGTGFAAVEIGRKI